MWSLARRAALVGIFYHSCLPLFPPFLLHSSLSNWCQCQLTCTLYELKKWRIENGELKMEKVCASKEIINHKSKT